MPLVFDLDGVIVDSRRATQFAYESTGVTWQPEYFHGGAKDWATQRQRDEKARVYVNYLRMYGRLLPCAEILLQTGGTVISGCSSATMRAFLSVYPQFVRIDICIRYNMTPDEKIGYLNGLSNNGRLSGVYFDDWAHMVQRVREKTQWKSVDVSRF